MLCATGARDSSIWRKLKKWGYGRIHRVFLSLHRISIVIIFNHYEYLFDGPRFDGDSPRYFCGSKVSDIRGRFNHKQKSNFMTPVPLLSISWKNRVKSGFYRAVTVFIW
jgi:hypothetical protein